MKLWHVFLAIAAVVLLATGAHADAIPASSYAINGSMTIPGNGSFTETIDFAFTLDYFTVGSYLGGPIYGYYATIPGPVLVAASGPLGLFGGSSQIYLSNGLGAYIPFVNSASPTINSAFIGNFDEIDLDMNNLEEGAPFAPFSGPPTLASSEIYRCDTATCQQDFSATGGPTILHGPYGTAQFTATAIPTPEPPMILLTAIGILGLVGMAWRQNRRLPLRINARPVDPSERF